MGRAGCCLSRSLSGIRKTVRACFKGELPENWHENLPVFEEGSKFATRASSGEVLNAVAKSVRISLAEVPTLPVRTKQQSMTKRTLPRQIMPDVISGLVYVNMQWVLL